MRRSTLLSCQSSPLIMVRAVFLSNNISNLSPSLQVVISDNEMVILGGSGSQADIEKRCEQLRSAIKASTSDYEIKLLEERLLNLSCGALIVKVVGLRFIMPQRSWTNCKLQAQVERLVFSFYNKLLRCLCARLLLLLALLSSC